MILLPSEETDKKKKKKILLRKEGNQTKKSDWLRSPNKDSKTKAPSK